ncbi:hypothetical protein GCM10017673_34980 [Streptosporangium violaceochromogenes]|nr:hypothetical protein GCM10017673_34980 [Streptosporangium violaceochromogenes]
MTGWWRRARVVSAVGAGTLVLGGGSAVYAVGVGEPAAPPSGEADVRSPRGPQGAEGPGGPDNPGGARGAGEQENAGGARGAEGTRETESAAVRPRWVGVGDVVRFRVWLTGPGSDARLVVATTPAEVFRGIDCPSAADERVPVRIDRRVCAVGEVGARGFVDVLLAVPREDQPVELTAVARMRAPRGEWVTQTARTRVEAPVALAVEAVEEAGGSRRGESVWSWAWSQAMGQAGAGPVTGPGGEAGDPSAVTVKAGPSAGPGAPEGYPVRPAPAPGVLPQPPGTGFAGPGGAPSTAGRVEPGTTPGGRDPDNGPDSRGPDTGAGKPPAGALPPLSPSAREVLQAPGVLRDLGVVGEPQAHAVPPAPAPVSVAVPAPVRVPVPAPAPAPVPVPVPAEVPPPGPEAVPSPGAGDPAASAQPVSPPRAPVRPSKVAGPPKAVRPAKGRKPSRAPGVTSPGDRTSAVPAPPPASAGLPEAGLPEVGLPETGSAGLSGAELSEAGRMPRLWSDPGLRMPLAVPSPVVTPPPSAVADARPLGAPLPRDVDGPGREPGETFSPDLALTGARGFPVVGAAMGGLFGLLWLQAKVRYRRKGRPVL